MFRTVAGLAIITTMCVLSPERDSKNDSTTTHSWPPSAFSASLDTLAGSAVNPALSKVVEAGRREAIAVALPAAGREAAASGLETIRRIVIPPPAIHVEMPPLRR
jgi:hypothetical protein